MIPGKAIEAAAKAHQALCFAESWESLSDFLREKRLREAELILEAAVPYLHNPYRDQPVRLSEARLDAVWNYIQSDDPLMTCPACRAAVAWSDKDDHLKWHNISQWEGE